MYKNITVAAAVVGAFNALVASPAAADDNAVVAPEVRVMGSGIKINAQGSLRDEIVKTESVDAKAIERANASNLTQALDNRPGISVQIECSVCNVRNITLNNMPGRFTTLMIDGIPLWSSVSTSYGLDSVNVMGVERIDISRGAGASLIAPEALSGTVNIVTKRPDKAEFTLRGQAGNFGEFIGDGYFAKPLQGGAITASFNYNRHDSVDGVGYGISQYTGYDRKLGGIGYFVDDVGGFRLRGRVDLVNEKRGGGPLGNDYAGIKTDIVGNPFNFSAGPHGSPDPNGWVSPDGTSGPDTLSNGQNGVLYNGGRAGISQIIFTERQQATAIGERNLGDGKLRLAAGYAHHYQDSFYGADGTYLAHQHQYYLEASYQQPWGKSLVTLGTNYRYEDLRSHGVAFNTDMRLTQGGAGPLFENNGTDDYTYKVPALFAQIYRPFFEHDRLEVNASVRYDKHNVFGGITSPRFNALFHHTDAVASRFSIGRGFRAPTSFFEQEHGILADGLIVRQISKPEISDNASYALSYSSDRFSWVASANYTKIKNFAMLSAGQCDPADAACVASVAAGTGVAPSAGFSTATLFTSAPDPVTFRTVDWVGTYQATPSTALSLGLEKNSYAFVPGTLAFSRPGERVYLQANSEFGGWDITARATWTGRQNLAKFYDYVDNQRFNLDGSAKPDWSPSFSVVDVRAQYRIDKRFAAFVGSNNLFDYQQAKHESYLWVDSAGSIDVTQIWGPNIGRTVYAGIRADLW